MNVMREIMRKIRKKDIIYIFIMIVVLYIILFFSLELYNKNLKAPFEYSGDVVGVFSEIKNMTLGNGLFYNPNLAAPFGSNQALANKGYLLHYLFIYFIGVFTKDAALILNLFYLLSFGLVAFTAFISFRLIGFKNSICTVMAIVYSILPYHFFRYEQHIYLAAYYTVPLSCVVLIWFFTGKFENGKSIIKKAKFINVNILVGMFFSFLLGISDFYYSAFYLIFLCFLTFCMLVSKRKIKYFYFGFVNLIANLFGILICYLPYLYDKVREGIRHVQYNDRTAEGLDYYSLKISQLIMPIQNHRITFLRNIREAFDQAFTYVTENSMSSLGLVLTIGFILSIFVILCFKANNDKKLKFLSKLGILNIFAILLSVNGGLSAFIAFFVTAVIRCYTRTSVYIAFFSAVAVCVGLDYLREKIIEKQHGKKIINVILIMILLIAAVDQIPLNAANGSIFNPTTGKYEYTISEVEELYYIEKRFVENIERISAPGTNILQLPIVSNYYSSLYPNGNTSAYTQMRPYLHSNGNLYWSYGSIVGDTTDYWLRNLNKIENFKEQINTAVVYGFTGVYVDSKGYTEEELKNVLDIMSEISLDEPIVSESQELYYWDISNYAENYLSTLKDEELETIQHQMSLYYGFETGCISTQKDENDTLSYLDKEASISLYNFEDTSYAVLLTGEIITSNSCNVKITLDGNKIYDDIITESEKLNLDFTVGTGLHEIQIECNNIDNDDMVFVIKNLSCMIQNK